LGKLAHTFHYTPVDLADSYSPPEVPDSAGATWYFYNLDRQIVRTLFPDSSMIDVIYESAGCGCSSGSRPAKIVFNRGEITTKYNSDTPGNLNSVILPNGDDIVYIIDGQNRRIGKMVNGYFLTGCFYQDQLNLVAEIDSLVNITIR
jgi:hypothetical protein